MAGRLLNIAVRYVKAAATPCSSFTRRELLVYPERAVFGDVTGMWNQSPDHVLIPCRRSRRLHSHDTGYSTCTYDPQLLILRDPDVQEPRFP